MWADASLLTRALFNLLENAIKYSPSGTCVSLDVKVGDNPVELQHSRSGAGIGVEELPQLFDPYKRFTSSVSTEGLGLGLSMVKAVIDRHDGRITAPAPKARARRSPCACLSGRTDRAVLQSFSRAPTE